MPINWVTAGVITLAAGAAGVAAGAALTRRSAARPPGSSPRRPVSEASGPARSTPGVADSAYDDAGTIELNARFYELVFGPVSTEPTLHSDHVLVLKQTRDAIGGAIASRQYFPRRPMVLPQLLHATRNPDGGLKDIVDIILQDPVLTGDVLKLANSAYYRSRGEPAASLDRAVSVLGIDGLRTVVSATVLQPVFRPPKGRFENFPTLIWDQALKSALAAQAYARRSRSCDPFSAHLLGLLTAIGRIVLFRLTLDRYAQKPALAPEPQIFITLLDEQADRIALAIAADWDFDPAIRDALKEHVARRPVDQLSPLARALYYGRLCGSAAVLFENGRGSEPKGLAQQKGLEEKDFECLWQAVLPASAED